MKEKYNLKKNGVRVRLGTLLKPEKWSDATPIQCVLIGKGSVSLRHQASGSLSIVLTTKEFKKSKWVVSGFSKIK